MSFVSLARRLSAALALAAFAACGDPAAPDPEVTRDIEITNVFASSSGASFNRANTATISITKVRITVVGSPSGDQLFQKTYDVDPAQSKWTLPFSAPVGETVRIIAELISVSGGQEKVEYSGQAGPLAMTECVTGCAPIPVKVYPGPTENLNATSVTLSPDAPSVVEGQTTTLTATVAPAGTYTIAWKSLDPSIATVNETGVVTGVLAGSAKIEAAVGSKADTVNVTVTAANTCVETTYAVGSTANGTWTAGDCTFATSGRKYDSYAVTLTQQTSFTVQLSGPTGRRVQVRRAGTQDYVQVMASEAFMPAATNPLQVGYVLPAGSYVMEVVTPNATTLGTYSLATTTTLPSGCSTLVFTWPGVTIGGSIESTDCARPGDNGREDRYIILPDAGVRLALGMTSAAFPVSVNLLDVQTATPVMLAYDRPFELGMAKVAYTTTFAGFHNVAVTHNTASSTGAYTLTIGTESATNTCNTIPVDVGERLAKWETTDCAADGRLYDKYTFTTDEQIAFKVNLNSTATEKSAGLFQNGVEVLDWIRSSAGDLTAAWVVPAGTYEVRVAAPAASAGATYAWNAQEIFQIDCTVPSLGTNGNVTLPNQSLGTGDCMFNNSTYEDRLFLYLEAGKTIEVTMDGTTVAPAAIIRDPATASGTVIVRQARSTPGSVTATHTTTVAGYYQVIFSTDAPGQTGAYSGSIVIR
jgi:uncharacterized protein YjdB